MDESIVKHLEQPAKVLKLSEAIRIGAKIRPQCSGDFFYEGRSCALGAALEGIGKRDEALEYHAKEGGGLIWPWSMLKDEFGIASQLQSAIASRNDSGESRESIADWLESRGY